MKILLWLLLIAGIVRLWVMPLPSSFWVDEMGTAFVVHYGGNHPSFAPAPQVPASIYYVLPRISEALLGFSEVSYRLPSLLLMLVALWLIARLAARLVHPEVGWLAVFACLSLKGFNYEAADARPYALGTCIAALSVWLLVRWFDTADRRNALLFGVAAALLWRVHLIFWPFYLVYALYAAVRLWRCETPVTWKQCALVFVLLGVALLPVALEALTLNRQAGAHVIAPLPSLRELERTLKIRFLAGCLVVAFLLGRLGSKHSKLTRTSIPWPAVTLIAAWWLCHPLALFAYSWLTGASVWVPRYLALALPGVGLMAALVVSLFLPAVWWRPVSAAFGLGVLLVMAQWDTAVPVHHNSQWREAAQSINQLSLGPETPVICPSPFIEAKPPVWTPAYPLPGFLYSYLPVYPLQAKPYLFPFESSPEAERYGRELSQTVLPTAKRFFIYGGDYNVKVWSAFFTKQPELSQWRPRSLGQFGDVSAVVFEKNTASALLRRQ